MSFTASPTVRRDGFASAAPPGGDITVDMSRTTEPSAVTINEDGSVEIAPIRPKARQPDKFNANLAERVNDGLSLAMLAEELADGVEADIRSRVEFIEQYAEAMKLLGLKIEDSGSTKGQKRNVTNIQHPLLLECVIKAQSSAGGELMPAAGPTKVQVNGLSIEALDDAARDLETDMNFYLTKGAPEYYPDMDRGLFGLFFSGNMFKKVYFHPVRRRPVADVLAVEDLIVSQDASDIDTALRVTHQNTAVTRPLLRRMQNAGAWRDIDLASPMPNLSVAEQAKNDLMGLTQTMTRDQDAPWTVYETTTDLVLGDYGWDDPLAPDDLPVPYVVTFEKETHAVLAVRRGWKKNDDQYQRRGRFVHYGMVPAFGFLCIGLQQMLGNQTKVLTAIWRLMIDAGMFASFPGGVKAKGVRTDTNEISPGPGEWQDIDLNGADDIRKILQAMPYRDPSATLIQLSEIIGQDAQRLGGAVELEVGEGRTNVPVGTMMSMIEQATQVMSAVHKRLHRAQARELQLIKDCFAEHPETLWRLSPNPARQWAAAEDFANFDLVPVSDPNVPSQIHRIQLATALVQVATENPSLYDLFKVHQRVWRQVGVGDAASFMKDPSQAPVTPPDPKAAAAMAATQVKQQELALKGQQLQADQAESQRKAISDADQNQQQLKSDQIDAQRDAASDAAKQNIAAQELEIERMRLQAEQIKASHDMQTAHAHLALDAAKTHHEISQPASGFGEPGGVRRKSRKKK